MTRLAIFLVRQLDLPMWRAAARGRTRIARALAIAQDLVEFLALRPQGKQIATVRPVKGLS